MQRRQRRREGEIRDRRGRVKRGGVNKWRSLILHLLTVSLEDLRLLMLEARVVLMDLKEGFFLGSGSALPLFLSYNRSYDRCTHTLTGSRH